MKHRLYFVLSIGLFLGLTINSQASLLFQEGFNYSTGNLTNWSNPNVLIQVNSPGLTLAGLTDTTPSGNRVSIVPDGVTTGKAQTSSFASVTSGTVYCGFLINCTVLPTANQYIIGMVTNLSSGVSGGGDPIVLYTGAGNSGFYKMGVRTIGFGSGAAFATNQLSPNTTYFMVLKYTFGASVGKAELFISPNPIDTEPANNDAVATGTNNAANLTLVSIKAQNATTQGNWDIDTIRVGTTWADVAPTSSGCTAAGISTQPSSQTNYVGLSATFSIFATGTSPTYQWQISTNSGANWNSAGATATNASYSTPALALTNSGYQYRCVATASCGSATNSQAATLTVLAVPTFGGVVVSNRWLSGTFTNPPPPKYSDTGVMDGFGDIESSWFAIGSTSTPGLTNFGTGSMTGISQTNSRVWLTHFTSNGVVHLNTNETIKATMVFSPDTVNDNTNFNLRIGLFNYFESGASRLVGNLSSAGSGGANVQGYEHDVNFSPTFHTNAGNLPPFIFRVRTNLTSANLMANTSDFTALGSGGASEGSAGFQAGSTYTNVFSVTHNADNTVSVSSAITGAGGFNYTYSVTDTLGTNDVDFDTYAFRPASDVTTAANFTFTLFKIEKVTATVRPTLILQRSGSNVILSWTDATFALYSGTDVRYITNLVAGGSPATIGITGSQKYFRLQK